ncbi:MAG TPA: hypothetical protein VMW42_04865 [Desulfatiglandales bacterium]|nr:hypothetical protein [Desulfatiglandales bacterium]
MIDASDSLFFKQKIILQQEGDYKRHLKLSKDEVVEGKVLRSLPLNRASLLIKGTRVTAGTQLPLKEGSVLSLKVEEAGPIPLLKPLGLRPGTPNTSNISTILLALKENLWKSAFENIHLALPKEKLPLFKELITHLTQRLFLKSSPELLKVLVDRYGFSWETKLRMLLLGKTFSSDNLDKLIDRDLKGLASRLVNLRQGGEENVLDRFVSTITNIQLLNRLEIGQEGKIFLPIPVQFPDGHFVVGQLLINLPKKEEDKYTGKKNDRSLFRITFLLELSYLGPIRADLTVNKKEIAGRFLLANDEARLLVQDNIFSLIGNLEKRGFNVHSIECWLKDPEIITRSFTREIIDLEGYTISLVA